MQIKQIGLYSHDGRVKEIALKLGQLNIISGPSGSGKTALLQIIDYCFGRSKPDFPDGPITNKVAWFALIVEHNGSQLLLGRPALKGASSSTGLVAAGKDLELPEPDAMEVNADRKGLRAEIDRMLGLGAFELPQYTGAREVLRAGAGHAVIFCLQEQEELMGKKRLFHRQDDKDVETDFRQLFPYFVGGVDEETLARRRQLSELRRQLKAAERDLIFVEEQHQDALARDRALVQRAEELGLVEGTNADSDDPLALLRDLRPASTAGKAENGDSRETINDVRTRLSEARSELRILQDRRAAVLSIAGAEEHHIEQLKIQHGRLGIHLKHERNDENESAGVCAVCGADLVDSDTTAAQLALDAERLREQVAEIETAAGDVSAAEHEFDGLIDARKGEISQLQADLEALAAVDAAARESAQLAEKQAFLRGVVDEHVRIADLQATGSRPADLRARIKTLGAEIAQLEGGTSTAEITEAVDARLAAIGEPMTAWARELNLEHSERGPVRIDPARLNVVIETSDAGRLPLSQIGAGANHVGYHIVAHLALHQHFVEQSRPVPRFVFLDQPSLPFFPKMEPDDTKLDQVEWDEVRQFIQLADRVTQQQGGALQAIVTDHAYFPGEKWFDDALALDFHDGSKLVPDEWPRAST